VPTMYNAFVNHPDVKEYGLNCFKFCSSGSAPLPIEVINRFEEITGAVIGEGFGMSETSPSTHRNPPFGERKIGSIGIPFPGTDCQIVDEDGNELPPKSVGELAIKG
ncbi:AMP-binding protein, partial [Micrococcus sp. SIMBA_144]